MRLIAAFFVTVLVLVSSVAVAQESLRPRHPVAFVGD